MVEGKGKDGAACANESSCQIFTIAMTVVVVLADVKYGWDRHIWDLHPDMIQSANVIAFIAKLTFTLGALSRSPFDRGIACLVDRIAD